MDREALLKELLNYLEIKGLRTTDQDIRFFNDVLMLATNNGFRAAIGIDENGEKVGK